MNKKDLTGVILAGGKSKRLGFNKIQIKINTIPLFIDQIFKLAFFCDEILISTTGNNYEFVENELSRLNHYSDYYSEACSKETIPSISIIKDEFEVSELNYNNFNPVKDNVVPNKAENIGPINGIYSGLNQAKNFYCIFLAFDMPFISYNLLSLLSDMKNKDNKKKDAYIMNSEKGYEALCGIYSKNCINRISKNMIAENYKISDIYPFIKIKHISLEKINSKLKDYKIDNLNFFNINTKSDYDIFSKLYNNFVSISTSKPVTEILSNPGSLSNSRTLFCQKWKYFFYRKDYKF
jgi:molybdopterin-guanine dinucleotide biosynthesis protein A